MFLSITHSYKIFLQYFWSSSSKASVARMVLPKMSLSLIPKQPTLQLTHPYQNIHMHNNVLILSHEVIYHYLLF